MRYNMKSFLPDIVTTEVSDYFLNQSYSSKHELFRRTQEQIDELLRKSEFVCVTESGNVIHSQRFCGNAYGHPVHIKQALDHGYTKPCKKCLDRKTMSLLENTAKDR